ncbi:response regulator [Microbacterium xanthum]|uniref:response regulator n=1 Tax=Microbacterium xanthum TaxID=3079794 RepID=UPI002AD1FE11|nr:MULTISPECIES: response regulator [unclassified Microbacterium]MDZ8172977.1 response regulator [Microbacterium sp. KSW-48]MDZ8200863.1 response regulator [Microbacterium sp. SSW1-59]
MANSPDVLVIDDVEDQRELLQTLFTRAGCEVRTASGTAAAEPLLSAKAPDIAVVDLLLRGRDDGWKAMESIRTIAPTAKIVICSVLDPAQFPAADAHLPKPFTAVQVRRVLDQLKPS